VVIVGRLSWPGFPHCWSARLEQPPGPCPQPERHQSMLPGDC